MADEVNKEFFQGLDELLSKTDLKDVNAESTGFDDLPDGYYLTVVENVKLTTSKSSGVPMVSFQLKIVEDGTDVVTDENKNVQKIKLKGTKNRKIFKHYPFKDEGSVKRFVTDMLKFEGDEEGVSLLPKEAFSNQETLEDSIALLIGYNVYVQSNTKEGKDGQSTTWYNMISWKRASQLELPL